MLGRSGRGPSACSRATMHEGPGASMQQGCGTAAQLLCWTEQPGTMLLRGSGGRATGSSQRCCLAPPAGHPTAALPNGRYKPGRTSHHPTGRNTSQAPQPTAGCCCHTHLFVLFVLAVLGALCLLFLLFLAGVFVLHTHQHNHAPCSPAQVSCRVWHAASLCLPAAPCCMVAAG